MAYILKLSALSLFVNLYDKVYLYVIWFMLYFSKNIIWNMKHFFC